MRPTNAALNKLIPLGVIAAFCLCGASALSACTLLVPKFEVPPTFSVEVVYANRAVPGIAVQIWQQRWLGKPVREGLTNEKGAVAFENLPPGKYEVLVGLNTAFSNFVDIRVDAVQRAGRTGIVKVDWIRDSVLRTKRFNGVLRHLHENDHGPILRGIEIRVSDARSSTLVGTIKTDVAGRFDFRILRPGIYEVQIKPRLYRFEGKDYQFAPGGSFALEISSGRHGASRPVNLSILDTSCGLYWEITKLSAETRGQEGRHAQD